MTQPRPPFPPAQPRRPARHRRPAAALATLATLAGCATYAPRPLPQTVTLPGSVQALSVRADQLPFARLRAHRFDPSDGLDIDEVAMLAVAHNPQLRLARDGLGLARAQAFAAGLLPDPQLGITADHPTNGTAGNTNAFNLNLGYDVGALLARSSRRAAAGAEVQRVNLDLLWQEWQVVSQARLLFTRLRAQQQLLATLQQGQALLSSAARRSRQALEAGNVTLDTSVSDLAALQVVERQINELERARLQDRVALTSLLGLAPGTKLDLVGEPASSSGSSGSPGSAAPDAVPGTPSGALPKAATDTAADAAALRAGLVPRLAKRPDLLALQAGYRSQEAVFRGAVLAQFPSLNVGLTRARDTSGLYTMGFGLSLSLPIFNANRGNIAIERATRTRLYDEYQQRLASAETEVEAALANIPLLQAQQQRTDAAVAALGQLARRADLAFGQGNLTAADHTRLTTAWLDKQVESLQLHEALAEQRIALDTLLGPETPANPEMPR
ncbi:MAG: TolC family protein [Burkholderiales bacterium]|nr:TolC family protein [Burkholderiales bacterium]